MRVHVHARTHKHTHLHILTHACLHIHIRMHAYTHTTHTHTHTRIQDTNYFGHLFVETIDGFDSVHRFDIVMITIIIIINLLHNGKKIRVYVYPNLPKLSFGTCYLWVLRIAVLSITLTSRCYYSYRMEVQQMCIFCVIHG